LNEINDLLYHLARKPYGFVDYFKFISYYITGKKLFKESSKEMVCSESAAYLLGKLGVIDEQEHYDYISPGDLYDLLSYKKYKTDNI